MCSPDDSSAVLADEAELENWVSCGAVAAWLVDHLLRRDGASPQGPVGQQRRYFKEPNPITRLVSGAHPKAHGSKKNSPLSRPSCFRRRLRTMRISLR